MIRSESDLQEKFDYIVRNPFDAGLGEEGEYSWVWYPGIQDRNPAGERRADCTPRRADSPCYPLKRNSTHFCRDACAAL